MSSARPDSAASAGPFHGLPQEELAEIIKLARAEVARTALSEEAERAAQDAPVTPSEPKEETP